MSEHLGKAERIQLNYTKSYFEDLASSASGKRKETLTEINEKIQTILTTNDSEEHKRMNSDILSMLYNRTLGLIESDRNSLMGYLRLLDINDIKKQTQKLLSGLQNEIVVLKDQQQKTETQTVSDDIEFKYRKRVNKAMNKLLDVYDIKNKDLRNALKDVRLVRLKEYFEADMNLNKMRNVVKRDLIRFCTAYDLDLSTDKIAPILSEGDLEKLLEELGTTKEDLGEDTYVSLQLKFSQWVESRQSLEDNTDEVKALRIINDAYENGDDGSRNLIDDLLFMSDVGFDSRKKYKDLYRIQMLTGNKKLADAFEDGNYLEVTEAAKHKQQAYGKLSGAAKGLVSFFASNDFDGDLNPYLGSRNQSERIREQKLEMGDLYAAQRLSEGQKFDDLVQIFTLGDEGEITKNFVCLSLRQILINRATFTGPGGVNELVRQVYESDLSDMPALFSEMNITDAMTINVITSLKTVVDYQGLSDFYANDLGILAATKEHLDNFGEDYFKEIMYSQEEGEGLSRFVMMDEAMKKEMFEKAMKDIEEGLSYENNQELYDDLAVKVNEIKGTNKTGKEVAEDVKKTQLTYLGGNSSVNLAYTQYVDQHLQKTSMFGVGAATSHTWGMDGILDTISPTLAVSPDGVDFNLQFTKGFDFGDVEEAEIHGIARTNSLTFSFGFGGGVKRSGDFDLIRMLNFNGGGTYAKDFTTFEGSMFGDKDIVTGFATLGVSGSTKLSEGNVGLTANLSVGASIDKKGGIERTKILWRNNLGKVLDSIVESNPKSADEMYSLMQDYIGKTFFSDKPNDKFWKDLDSRIKLKSMTDKLFSAMQKAPDGHESLYMELFLDGIMNKMESQQISQLQDGFSSLHISGFSLGVYIMLGLSADLQQVAGVTAGVTLSRFKKMVMETDPELAAQLFSDVVMENKGARVVPGERPEDEVNKLLHVTNDLESVDHKIFVEERSLTHSVSGETLKADFYVIPGELHLPGTNKRISDIFVSPEYKHFVSHDDDGAMIFPTALWMNLIKYTDLETTSNYIVLDQTVSGIEGKVGAFGNDTLEFTSDEYFDGIVALQEQEKQFVTNQLVGKYVAAISNEIEGHTELKKHIDFATIQIDAGTPLEQDKNKWKITFMDAYKPSHSVGPIPFNSKIRLTQPSSHSDTYSFNWDTPFDDGPQFEITGMVEEKFEKEVQLNFEKVPQKIHDFFSSEAGTELVMWRHSDSGNASFKEFGKIAVQAFKTPENQRVALLDKAWGIAIQKMPSIVSTDYDIGWDAPLHPDTKKAVIDLIYARQSRVDMTMWKHMSLEKMSDKAQELKNSLESETGIHASALEASAIDEILDSDGADFESINLHVDNTGGKTNKELLEGYLSRTLGTAFRYGEDSYNRVTTRNEDGTPNKVHQLGYLLAPTRMVMETRNKAYEARILSEHNGANLRMLTLRNMIVENLKASPSLVSTGTVLEGMVASIATYEESRSNGHIGEKFVANPGIITSSIVSKDVFEGPNKIVAYSKYLTKFFTDLQRENIVLYQEFEGGLRRAYDLLGYQNKLVTLEDLVRLYDEKEIVLDNGEIVGIDGKPWAGGEDSSDILPASYGDCANCGDVGGEGTIYVKKVQDIALDPIRIDVDEQHAGTRGGVTTNTASASAVATRKQKSFSIGASAGRIKEKEVEVVEVEENTEPFILSEEDWATLIENLDPSLLEEGGGHTIVVQDAFGNDIQAYQVKYNGQNWISVNLGDMGVTIPQSGYQNVLDAIAAGQDPTTFTFQDWKDLIPNGDYHALIDIVAGGYQGEASNLLHTISRDINTACIKVIYRDNQQLQTIMMDPAAYARVIKHKRKQQEKKAKESS